MLHSAIVLALINWFEQVRRTISLQNFGGEARSTIGGAVITSLLRVEVQSVETRGLVKLIKGEKGPCWRIKGSCGGTSKVMDWQDDIVFDLMEISVHDDEEILLYIKIF